MEHKRNYKCKQINGFIERQEPSLLIFGSPGTGKTFAMEFIQDELLSTLGYDQWQRPKVLMATTDSYVQDMWKNFRKFKGDESTFDKYLYKPVLLLDDLGTEISNADSDLFIFKLLNERTLPMVISTNLTPEELRIRYGERIFSRIIGRFILVEFTGDDWRMAGARIEKADL